MLGDGVHDVIAVIARLGYKLLIVQCVGGQDEAAHHGGQRRFPTGAGKDRGPLTTRLLFSRNFLFDVLDSVNSLNRYLPTLPFKPEFK